ncbi:MAG TPA: T9SS type A sorting domain-containing protein [Bacteroidia bacterium]|jgi:hypothetical protein|nr:T9SS type A sorting domain-containing protein [Bacteroidia bacterium]
MKKALRIAALSLSLSSSLFGQITITNSDIVHAGDSIRVSYAATTNNVDHTQSGPNFTWDFSTLQPYAQQMDRYTQPSAIPFTFIATVSHTNPSPDSLPGLGNIPSDFTDQYKGSSSSFREVGFSFSYAPLGNFSVPVLYSSNDYIYRFPLTYPHNDTSDAAWTLNAAQFGLFYIGATIHRVNNVDGWGTLYLPHDTVQCIRLVSVITEIDTIGTDSVTGFTIPRPIKAEYKWLAAGKKIPVLQVETQLINNAEVVSNVIYQDDYDSTLFQVGMSESENQLSSSFYPNPASDLINMTIDLKKSGPVSIEIMDLSGKTVLSEGEGAHSAGEFSTSISTHDLSAGTYVLRVSSSDQLNVHKLVIIR